MDAILFVVLGAAAGKKYRIDRAQVTIGRDPGCDIVIPAPGVSRKHARIVRAGAAFVLEDLGSRNGTLVNSRKIADRHELRHGDRLTICDTEFVFQGRIALVAESGDDPSLRTVYVADASDSSATSLALRPEEKLRAIVSVANSLAIAITRDQAVDKALETVLELFPQADCCMALLGNAEHVVHLAARRRDHREEVIRYSASLVKQVLAERHTVLIERVADCSESSIGRTARELGDQSLICAPLLPHEQEPIGVIQASARSSQDAFKPDDAEILTSVAKQVGIALENIRLQEKERELARLHAELEFARAVQDSLLPQAAPELSGYTFWSYYEPARIVGGDFFDFLALPNQNHAVFLGDVAGKGVPASLHMARISNLCRVMLLQHPEDPAAAMRLLNQQICAASHAACLATLALGVLNPRLHRLTIGNAGHYSPIVLRSDGSLDETAGDAARGLVLGCDAEERYVVQDAALDPGDSVVMFSDGLTDAMNEQGDLYGLERIRLRLRGLHGENAADIGQALLLDVEAHLGNNAHNDDMCLVVIRRN